MSDLYSRVDSYFEEALVGDELQYARDAAHAAGLPAIEVSPCQAKFLHLMAKGAKRILEVGTLGGYSGIWLTRALANGGKLVTLEVDPKHAEVARANFTKAGIADRAEVIVGKAIDNLPKLEGPFDFVFIDADKPSNADYFAHALRMSRPGTIIIVDNVVRGGKVADPSQTDANVEGVRRLLELLKTEKRVSATAVQTVGSKGHDGFVMAVVGG